ncbi:Exocyst complex component 6B, partial [Operophtera brumata]
MNATIQEIEGIDDYWGPAFRSVYEGEGHEAFVQQLDERIVHHDKEIEKLFNEIALTVNWTDQQVVDYAVSKLAGSAKSWHEGVSSNLSWHKWQKKLEAAFPLKENYGKLLFDMLSKTAKIGDSLDDYYCDKIALLNKCSIRGERAVECIIFGIEDEAVRTKAEAEVADDPDKLLAFLANLKKNNANNCGFIDSIRELLDVRARRVELNIAATIEKMELCLPLLTTYSKLKAQTLEQLEHVLLPRVGPYKWCGTISADIPRLRQAIRDASMADLRDFLENIRKLSPQVGAMALKQSQEMMGRNLATIRKQQARLVLIPAATNLHDSIRGVKDYLNAVLGFFILEEHLLSAAAGLVSKDWLLDTWSMSVNKVASTLRTNTSLITDPTLMLSIKHQIVLFINTVNQQLSLRRQRSGNAAVPKIEFIYAWLKYSSGLGLGGGRRAAAARHSASLLLSRSFTGCLSALFHSPLPLMQLVQPVAGLFQSARDEAEQQICDNLQKK